MYSVDITNFSISNLFIILGFSLLIGIIYAISYAFINRKQGYDKSFMVTLIVLPAVIATIIMCVGSDYARAFSIAGIFALVKFRMNVSGVKNMLFIIFSTAIGLALGIGYVIQALIIAVILCLVLVVISFTKLEDTNDTNKRLKITIPENLNYSHLFDNVFDKYLVNSKLTRVKTTDFGTMFELSYVIKTKKEFEEKEFLDELRVLNGNLNIVLVSDYEKEYYDITH